MDITAFFVFAENCGACIYYKTNLQAEVRRLYERQGVTIVERTAQSMKGLTEAEASGYKFLMNVKFFPCIMLVHNDVLESAKSPNEVLLHASVYNGIVTNGFSGVTISTVNPGPYRATVDGFVKFLTDFQAKGLHYKPEQPKDTTKKVVTISTPSSAYSSQPNYCRGVIAIPHHKK